MSFGGGRSYKAPAPVLVPRTISVDPEVTKAKEDLRERLKRARSRAMSKQTTPGLLTLGAPTYRPVLSDLL